MNKSDDTQIKSKPKTYNSFVPPGAKFEFEIDTMDTESKDATSNARYGLVAIGNFTKIAEVAPIRTRTPETMIDGFKKIFTSMGKPKQLYSDEESSMRFAKMNRFLNENETKSVQTTTHAHTVERFTRTFKMNLHRILDALSENKAKWITHKIEIFQKVQFN